MWRWRPWQRMSTSRPSFFWTKMSMSTMPRTYLWALSTRVRWQDAMVPIPGIHGNELDPTSDAHGVMCKTIIDATMPAEERARYRKITQPSVDLSAYLGKPA